MTTPFPVRLLIEVMYDTCGCLKIALADSSRARSKPARSWCSKVDQNEALVLLVTKKMSVSCERHAHFLLTSKVSRQIHLSSSSSIKVEMKQRDSNLKKWRKPLGPYYCSKLL